MADRGRQLRLRQQPFDQPVGQGVAAEAPDIAPPGQELGKLRGEGLVEAGRGAGLVHAHPATAIAWKNEPVTWPRRLPAGVGAEPCGSLTSASGGSSPWVTIVA